MKWVIELTCVIVVVVALSVIGQVVISYATPPRQPVSCRTEQCYRLDRDRGLVPMGCCQAGG